MTDEAAKALLARLQSRWPDEDCLQAVTLIGWLDGQVEGLQTEVIRLRETADQLDGFLTASQADRDGLEAEVLRLREALEPFAEALAHLHPALPDDGVTMDGFEVADFRRAFEALNTTSPTADPGGRDGK